MDKILGWATKSLQNLVLIISIAGSLLGAIYFWAKDKIRDFQSYRKEKDARDDANIANSASKRGSDLLDSLSDD